MSRKAFTLVELLVVIAIISLLISILAPSLNVAKDIAKQVTCSTTQSSAAKGLLLYCEQSGDKYPPYRSTWYSGKPKMFPYPCVENTMWASKVGDVDAVTLQQRYRGAAMAFSSGYIEDARYFYCVAQANNWFRLDQYTYNTNVFPPVAKRWGMWDNWSSMIRMGYWFNTTGKFYASEVRWDIASRSLNSMEQDKALMIDQPVFPWAISVHTAKGADFPTLNITYSDGHVEPKTSSVIMDVLLINWGGSSGGVLKNWADNSGPNNDWAEAYEIIQKEM